MEVGKSQGGFITSPKANTVQLHSVTGSRRPKGAARTEEEGGSHIKPGFASLCYLGQHTRRGPSRYWAAAGAVPVLLVTMGLPASRAG